MLQHFSRPDRWLGRCGRLNCVAHEWRVGNAPAFMRDLRALFVADTHVRPNTADTDIRAFTDRLAALSPDILLLGGDYADRTADARRLFAALGALRPPLGAYGCVGNNDAEAWSDPAVLGKAMAEGGVKLLVNAAERVSVNGGEIIVGGVDERKFGAPRAAELFPKVPSANIYRVLLSHYPCTPDAKPDLMLSGHTHGGQFNLLGVTPFTVGFERLLPKNMRLLATAGMFEIGGMRLLVSKGVGASRKQWRVGVRPEIDLLTFG